MQTLTVLFSSCSLSTAHPLYIISHSWRNKGNFPGSGRLKLILLLLHPPTVFFNSLILYCIRWHVYNASGKLGGCWFSRSNPFPLLRSRGYWPAWCKIMTRHTQTANSTGPSSEPLIIMSLGGCSPHLGCLGIPRSCQDSGQLLIFPR